MQQADVTQTNKLETGYSILVRNKKYAGMELFPLFPVDDQKGDFYRFALNTAFKSGDVKRAEDGPAKEVRWKPELDSYRTTDKAKRIWVRDITERLADAPVRPSRRATLMVTNELLLGHEKEVATLCTDTSVFTQGITLSGTSQFNDYTNSDPLDVFSDMRIAMKFLPFNNGLPLTKVIAVMSPETFEILRFHPDVRGLFSNMDGLVQLQQMAVIMGVDQVILSEAQYDSTDDAADFDPANLNRVWGNDIFIAYVDPTKALDTMTMGWTVSTRMPFTSGIVQGESGTPFRIRDYREEAKGGGGFWRECDAMWDLKVVMPELAYLITNAVA